MRIKKGRIMEVGFSLTILAGCASAPPDFQSYRPQSLPVPVDKLIVSNFVLEAKRQATDFVWASGFVPLTSAITVPPVHELMMNALRAGLVAEAGDGKGALEIAVLRADVLMESRMADSVVFVGILSIMGERKYMCRLDANFRYRENSVRNAFEVLDIRNRVWDDLETHDKEKLVTDCVDRLVREVREYAVEFVKQ